MHAHGPVAMVLAALAGCGTDSRTTEDGTGSAGVSYYRDVYPILQTKCVGCHAPDGIGPQNFDASITDQAARDAVISEIQGAAFLILDRTKQGAMPPYPPTTLTPATHEENRLTAEELATLEAWVAAEMPVGDPADAPMISPALPFPITAPPDVTVDTGTGYVPPVGATIDQYRCFAVPSGVTADRKLIGWQFVPEDTEIMHHAIIVAASADSAQAIAAVDAETAEPGWPCSGGTPSQPGIQIVGQVGTYTPGRLGYAFFPGTALNFPAGSILISSMHLNTAHADANPVARATIKLHFAPETEEAALVPLGRVNTGTPQINIPPDTADVVVTRTVTNPTERFSDGAGYMVGTSCHCHLLCSACRITKNKGRSDEEIVLDIAKWDFDWQGAYSFVDPLTLDAGDTLTQDCTYDNTTQHRLAVGLDPAPVTVRFGEKSSDEMCLGGATVVDRLP